MTLFSDNNEMPIAIQLSARGILDAQSATNKEEMETASAQWEGDLIVESKFSEDLLQVNLKLWKYFASGYQTSFLDNYFCTCVCFSLPFSKLTLSSDLVFVWRSLRITILFTIFLAGKSSKNSSQRLGLFAVRVDYQPLAQPDRRNHLVRKKVLRRVGR